MRRKIFLLPVIVLAMGMLFASCNDDHDRDRGSGNGGGSGTGKQLTCITLTEDGFCEAKAELNWTGELLTRAELYENSNGHWMPLGYVEPQYNGTQMTNVYIYDYDEADGFTVNARWQSDKLVEVTAFNERLATIGYDASGRPNSINIDGDILSLQWQNDNISYLVADGERIQINYNQYTFPLNDLLGLLINNWTYGMNCPSSFYADGETFNIRYESSGNYPTVATINADGDEVKIYFQYADGTGGNPPTPVATYWIYYCAYPWEGGYVEDQDGYTNTERRCAAGSTFTLTAVPYSGYSFVGWSDGNTQNPRTITVNSDITMQANFTANGGGSSTTTASVSFGGYTWNNVTILDNAFAYFNSNNQNYLNGLLFQTTTPTTWTDYPWMRILIPITYTGTQYYNIDDDGFLYDSNNNFAEIEYAANNGLRDNNDNVYGEWWGKSIIVNVTSYNFGTHTFSLNISGTLYDAVAHFVDGTAINSCATRSISVTLNNVSFVTESSMAQPLMTADRGVSLALPTVQALRGSIRK